MERKPNTSPQSHDEEILLSVLTSVESGRPITQRSLAKELGIALGLANAYLKRCVKKGYVKVTSVPPRRFAYYLTPAGFVEKTRLTGEYLRYSFGFFRDARAQCGELFGRCAANGWRRVGLAGAGELGEIALLCAAEYPVTVVGFIDGRTEPKKHLGLPVVANVSDLGAVDAVIVTDVTQPQATFDALAEAMPRRRLLVPPLLNVTTSILRPVE